MRPRLGGRRFLRQLEVEPVQRALDVTDRVDGDAGVERGRLQLRVAQRTRVIMRTFLCHWKLRQP